MTDLQEKREWILSNVKVSDIADIMGAVEEAEKIPPQASTAVVDFIINSGNKLPFNQSLEERLHNCAVFGSAFDTGVIFALKQIYGDN